MKKKTLRKMASLLALTLAVSAAFAGCGSKEEKPASTGKTDEVVESGTENGESGSVEIVERTGKVSVKFADSGTFPVEEGSIEDNRWTKWIRENMPIAELEIVIVPRADEFQTLSMQFAAGTAPDIYSSTDNKMIGLVNQGMALEITEEMLDKTPNYKALLEQYPIIRKCCSIDGKIYGFGSGGEYYHNHTLGFRQDWMENLGLDIPQTIEEFYDLCYAFTYDDPDGNGVDDTWGINMTTDAQRVISHMFGFGNPERYAFNEEGKYVYAWDRIEAWLTFCKRLVADGLVNPDYMTMKADDDQADFIAGRIGIWCTGRFNYYRTPFTSFKEANPDGKIGTFPLPETEFGEYKAMGNSGINNGPSINPNCKDVDAALKYIDWFYDPQIYKYLTQGPAGEYFEVNEYGTSVAKDLDRNSKEFDYRSGYVVAGSSTLTKEALIADGYYQSANHNYNKDLSSDDPLRHEYAIMNYKLYCIATEEGPSDPRVYLNQGKPVLPEELNMIASTTDKMVGDILSAGLGQQDRTAAEVVQEAKDMWYGSGGQAVDDWYADYYENNPNALLWEDFIPLYAEPEMTPIAYERAFNEFGFDADKYDIHSIYQK